MILTETMFWFDQYFFLAVYNSTNLVFDYALWSTLHPRVILLRITSEVISS